MREKVEISEAIGQIRSAITRLSNLDHQRSHLIISAINRLTEADIMIEEHIQRDWERMQD